MVAEKAATGVHPRLLVSEVEGRRRENCGAASNEILHALRVNLKSAVVHGPMEARE